MRTQGAERELHCWQAGTEKGQLSTNIRPMIGILAANNLGEQAS